MHRSGIVGSHDNSNFSYLRNLYTVLHRGYTNLHSYKLAIPIHITLHLLFVDVDDHSRWCIGMFHCS